MFTNFSSKGFPLGHCGPNEDTLLLTATALTGGYWIIKMILKKKKSPSFLELSWF
jgi:hypothetical protein